MNHVTWSNMKQKLGAGKTKCCVPQWEDISRDVLNRRRGHQRDDGMGSSGLRLLKPSTLALTGVSAPVMMIKLFELTGGEQGSVCLLLPGRLGFSSHLN